MGWHQPAIDDDLKRPYLRFSLLMAAAGYHQPNRGAKARANKRYD